METSIYLTVVSSHLLQQRQCCRPAGSFVDCLLGLRKVAAKIRLHGFRVWDEVREIRLGGDEVLGA